MKKKRFTKIIPIIIILAFIIAFITYRNVIKHPLKVTEDIVININEGDSFYSIINNLKEEDKLKGIPFIKLYVKLSNKNIEVKSGEYLINKDSSIDDIIEVISKGEALNLIDITIPEGYTIDDIASSLEDEGICSKEDFILAVNEYELPSYVKVNSQKRYNLEGYLFPDTYKVKIGETPKEIISKMILRFEEVFNSVEKDLNVEVENNDIEKIITIASIIEKEARLNSERALISSVIYNRLNDDRMLQIDATVIYALGEHIDKVYLKHLEVDSPYNTYDNYGLPIGPISNPGSESIKAALNPEKTDYLFYVLKDDNSHYFTEDENDFMNKLKELGYSEE